MLLVTALNVGTFLWVRGLPVPPQWIPMAEELPPVKGIIEQEITDLNYFGVSTVVKILERRIELARERGGVQNFSREKFVQDNGYESWDALMQESLTQDPIALDTLLEGYQLELQSLGEEF